MRHVQDVLVTSNTTMMDSITLRKKLREFEGGREASFLPGVGAWPQTRPSFTPAKVGETEIHPLFGHYCEIIAELYYVENVPISSASYGIRKDAKIGLPYNDKSDEAHLDLIKQLLSGPISFDYAGHYIYGTRIQTDSDKVRDTGYIQLKAVGDGFSAQRHRMINAGPAVNHLLGIMEFDYHHNWLNSYPETCNVNVDEFKSPGYKNFFAWDYKNFERSLGWDILDKAMINRLHYLGRHIHADLVEQMCMQCHIHYRPTFKNENQFKAYLACGSNVNAYMKMVNELYGTNFKPDELVEKTMKAIRDAEPSMRNLFELELNDKKSIIPGYSIFSQTKVFNNSGNAKTATDGKLYAIPDILCRLSDVKGHVYTKEEIHKFLKHELPEQLSNLGDDNMLGADDSFDFDKFLSVKTGVVVTKEIPVSFLSRILVPEISPYKFKDAWLMPQAKSFFRKMSRERDIRSYIMPSEGWVQSYAYARRNNKFAEQQREVLNLFNEHYMSIDAIIKDAEDHLDKPPRGVPIDAIDVLDNPGLLYKNENVDPVERAPFMFYAIGPEDRQSIEKFYK